MGQHHIWGVEEPKEGEEFEGWKHFLEWETARRAREAARDTNPHENEDNEAAEQKQQQEVPKPIDAVVICTLDQTHAEIVTALAPLGLHILCEKPLATTLDDCLRIYRTVKSMQPRRLFGIGHIVRYAPRNERLRKLLLEDEAIGEIVSVVHTEPIGWWHFAHSYVR
jgi:predicted dehydrogenase